MKTACFPVLRRRGARASTIVELLVIIVVLLMVGVLFLPSANRRMVTPTRMNCCNNLKQIGIAFRQFSIDHTNLFPMALSTNLGGSREWTGDVLQHYLTVSNQMAAPSVLYCPDDRQRTPAMSWDRLSRGNISYFVSLDADETQPQMVLAGDRNLTIDGLPAKPGILTLMPNSQLGFTTEIHNGSGNVVLADGSVQQLSAARLRDQIRNAGSTNRIAIP